MINPKVSVIVPVYNSQKYLNICVESILSQSFTDFECILINDFSTDNSLQICNEYEKKDSRIRIINNTANTGVSLSRKNGLNAACGNYILFADSDDYLENDMIKLLYEKALSEDYDMVVCDYFYNDNGVQTIQKQNFNSFNREMIIKNILSVKIKSVLWNKLVKRELYLKAYFPEFNRSEDYVITIQNIYNSNNTGYLDIPLYHYVYNDMSISNNKEKNIVGRIEENKNWQWVVNFLKEKYKGDLKIFEPELSAHVNHFKDIYVMNKNLRKNRELFKLYPESRYFRRLPFRLLKKIIKAIYNRAN
jgi:glycosyltransferase involved in cell wall biosynthesis